MNIKLTRSLTKSTLDLGKYHFYYRGPFDLKHIWGWKSLFKFDLTGELGGLKRVGLIGWFID